MRPKSAVDRKSAVGFEVVEGRTAKRSQLELAKKDLPAKAKALIWFYFGRRLWVYSRLATSVRILERGRHHSIEGVRKYQHTNILQEIQTCKAPGTRHKNLPEPPVAQPTAPSFRRCTFSKCIVQSAPVLTRNSTKTFAKHSLRYHAKMNSVESTCVLLHTAHYADWFSWPLP